MRDRTPIILLISIIIIATSVAYIFFNIDSPQIIGLTLGAVALGGVVGIAVELVAVLFTEKIKANPGAWGFVCVCLLCIFIATLVFSTNNPEKISEKIPVAYFLDSRTAHFPTTFNIEDQITAISYLEMHDLLDGFATKNPDTFQNLKRSLENSTGVRPSWNDVFGNLTAYLVAYFMGDKFVTTDYALSEYQETYRRAEAIPDPEIDGALKTLKSISGPFEFNLFYGLYAGSASQSGESEIRLPKDTKMSVKIIDRRTSKLIIDNRFVHIEIGVHPLGLLSGYHTTINKKAFYSIDEYSPSPYAERIRKEQRTKYVRYNVVIDYDATFKRLWYGNGDVKYYKEWTTDLLRMLKRRFAWGSSRFYSSPPYSDIEHWN